MSKRVTPKEKSSSPCEGPASFATPLLGHRQRLYARRLLSAKPAQPGSTDVRAAVAELADSSARNASTALASAGCFCYRE